MIGIFVRLFLIGVIFALLWINGKQATEIRILRCYVRDLEAWKKHVKDGGRIPLELPREEKCHPGPGTTCEIVSGENGPA